jgi:hypothetical protein
MEDLVNTRFYVKPNSGTSFTEAMRIEDSGDIRIGNYGTLFGNSGATIYGSSLSGGPQVIVSRISGNPILLNRNGTDGDIVEFRKGWGVLVEPLILQLTVLLITHHLTID